jgi:hypothetical protein
MQALAKMTIILARLLWFSVTQMWRSGRIGADGDIPVFCRATLLDVATLEKPGQLSAGVMHALFGGVEVVDNGRAVDSVFPGQPVRRLVAH